ncbi:MAG TPA: RNase adaptor protein RapZ, partial [Rhodospirillaceae bacterium]|nr:RNase adaptor protein RapZ [Rhodospirillaceae bacterium]
MSNNPSSDNISGKIRLVFITGMSGAGVSTTLSVFRDIGYEVFDNFPLFMVTDLLDHLPDAKALA